MVRTAGLPICAHDGGRFLDRVDEIRVRRVQRLDAIGDAGRFRAASRPPRSTRRRACGPPPRRPARAGAAPASRARGSCRRDRRKRDQRAASPRPCARAPRHRPLVIDRPSGAQQQIMQAGDRRCRHRRPRRRTSRARRRSRCGSVDKRERRDLEPVIAERCREFALRARNRSSAITSLQSEILMRALCAARLPRKRRGRGRPRAATALVTAGTFIRMVAATSRTSRS